MQRIRTAYIDSMVRAILILFILCQLVVSNSARAQQNFYDNDLLSPDFHKGRRDEFRKKMPANSMAVFFSNPVRNRTNDVDYIFAQDADLYYLTGLTEPESALLLFSEPCTINGQSVSEVLFIQGRDSAREVWTGRRIAIEEAAQKLGIQMVLSNAEFGAMLPRFQAFKQLMAKFPTDIKEGKSRNPGLQQMVYLFREKSSSAEKEVQMAPLMSMMAGLREIKTKEELAIMQKAIDMSVEGHSEAIRAVKPGMTEFQAQAIVEFFFKFRGSEYPGYGSISGGGENTCVLHYETNRRVLGENDLILMDMGAEYHGYTADITRTVPVSGKFSPEQKVIYELVLEAQEAGIRAAKAGNGFYEPHQAALAVISQGLVRLGIIDNPNKARRYFNHGTSHYLGIEVHDAGTYGPLKSDMVITVEPGIYIPAGSPCDKKWWNIGVRIEDDVLITDNEPFVMSGKLPRSVAELEKMMSEKSLFETVK